MRSSGSTATFAQRDAVVERLVEEVEAPGRLGGDGQQLGVVRRLGQALGGEAQGREREPLLEVPAAPRRAIAGTSSWRSAPWAW